MNEKSTKKATNETYEKMYKETIPQYYMVLDSEGDQAAYNGNIRQCYNIGYIIVKRDNGQDRIVKRVEIVNTTAFNEYYSIGYKKAYYSDTTIYVKDWQEYALKFFEDCITCQRLYVYNQSAEKKALYEILGMNWGNIIGKKIVDILPIAVDRVCATYDFIKFCQYFNLNKGKKFTFNLENVIKYCTNNLEYHEHHTALNDSLDLYELIHILEKIKPNNRTVTNENAFYIMLQTFKNFLAYEKNRGL